MSVKNIIYKKLQKRSLFLSIESCIDEIITTLNSSNLDIPNRFDYQIGTVIYTAMPLNRINDLVYPGWVVCDGRSIENSVLKKEFGISFAPNIPIVNNVIAIVKIN